jgi:hypothetical protein
VSGILAAVWEYLVPSSILVSFRVSFDTMTMVLALIVQIGMNLGLHMGKLLSLRLENAIKRL